MELVKKLVEKRKFILTLMLICDNNIFDLFIASLYAKIVTEPSL